MLPIRLAAGLLLLAAAIPAPAQELNRQTYRKYLERILPESDELAWKKIRWRPTFWQGVVEATRARKPILLWAMNGHPLGHT